MKKCKMLSTWYYVAAALFYLASLIYFVTGSNRSLAVVWLCLGSCSLCLGARQRNKEKASEKGKA